ncbi:aminotransferase class I/II-fold pyridoxal phosphate-dependent enzyme [Algoriphagus namhaensis]|uniref:Aminotransferase class I/II-fold pyridoxal phosphate-dependent enzyme n=1 Tax=Algoriphagus namhaensis TaxID=915353 RepID=A0ABV8AQ15_9BACT
MHTFNLDQRIDRFIHYQGKSYRYFSGTSYLGMGLSETFQEKVIEGIRIHGLSHGQSRSNNVRLSIYDEFESFFAVQAEADSAIVMSSGYLAGSAALQICMDADEVWVAPDTHPAILPTDLIPDIQQSFESWQEECLEKSASLSSRKILILGNAVDPLTSRVHDYAWIAKIGAKHQLSILIDDSHAFGVLGKGIFGSYAKLKSLPAEVLVSGSLGKGLGLPAGIILCSKAVQEKVLSLRIYGGASPCPPGYLYGFIHSQEVYASQRKKLSTNVKAFFEKTTKIPQIKGSEAFPVFIYSEDHWAEKLEKALFITSSFPYPTASDPKINRIVVSAFHEAEDLDLLSAELEKLASL